MTRPPSPFAGALLALATFLSPAAASALTLDAFTDAFPPNPCLPLSNQPVVFAGPYCDGTACPPDPLVTCGADDVVQLGLPGVLAGLRRHVEIYTWNAPGTVSARVDPADGRLLAALDLATEAGVMLNYGTPYDPDPSPPDALDLDLLALQAAGVQLDVQGGFGPAQPLFVAIEFLSDGPAPRPSATAEVVLQQPGPLFVPLADFVPSLGFSMSDVDDIQVWISNCTDLYEGCPSATFAPTWFSLGPIAFVTGPTPAARASWGRLKATYR